MFTMSYSIIRGSRGSSEKRPAHPHPRLTSWKCLVLALSNSMLQQSNPRHGRAASPSTLVAVPSAFIASGHSHKSELHVKGTLWSLSTHNQSNMTALFSVKTTLVLMYVHLDQSLTCCRLKILQFPS